MTRPVLKRPVRPFAKHQPETEQDECAQQRIERPFDRTRLLAAVDIVFFQLFDPGFDLVQSGMGGGGTHVNYSGFPGQSGQHLFVERHTDHIAAGVFQRLDIALFIAQLHDRGLRRIADTIRVIRKSMAKHTTPTTPNFRICSISFCTFLSPGVLFFLPIHCKIRMIQREVGIVVRISLVQDLLPLGAEVLGLNLVALGILALKVKATGQ